MPNDDTAPDFNAAAFNVEQRDWAEELLAPADGFPCWGCGRLTPLHELEAHGYACEDCHDDPHVSRRDRLQRHDS